MSISSLEIPRPNKRVDCFVVRLTVNEENTKSTDAATTTQSDSRSLTCISGTNCVSSHFNRLDRMFIMRFGLSKCGDGRWLWAFFGVSVAIADCSSPRAPVSHRDGQPHDLSATIQEIMDAEVDPSADALWDAVVFVSTTEGVEERRPHTDAEWKALRRSALTLVEATNLLSMKDRRVSATKATAASGEMSPSAIQRRIDATRGNFVQFARALQWASLNALAAIDAKDPKALLDAGAAIDETCEACHITYWYPNQN
jgi:hypothetical protein